MVSVFFLCLITFFLRRKPLNSPTIAIRAFSISKKCNRCSNGVAHLRCYFKAKAKFFLFSALHKQYKHIFFLFFALFSFSVYFCKLIFIKMERLLTIMKGATGLLASEVAQQIPDPTQLESIGKLILQVIITLVTIWSLVKKKKK